MCCSCSPGVHLCPQTGSAAWRCSARTWRGSRPQSTPPGAVLAGQLPKPPFPSVHPPPTGTNPPEQGPRQPPWGSPSPRNAAAPNSRSCQEAAAPQMNSRKRHSPRHRSRMAQAPLPMSPSQPRAGAASGRADGRGSTAHLRLRREPRSCSAFETSSPPQPGIRWWVLCTPLGFFTPPPPLPFLFFFFFGAF